jgi:hypothetical protein
VRRMAVAALALSLGTGCTTGGASTTSPVAGTTTTASPTTTTTVTTTVPATTMSTTTTGVPRTVTGGPPAVDMVPAGYDIEGFVPLVLHYFAVRNWALEHPDQATEEILATVIEPDSVEMRDTLAEIRDLVDQDAHYEGLSETFKLRTSHIVSDATSIEERFASVAVTYRYGNTAIVDRRGAATSSDSLRSLSWTIRFAGSPGNPWRAESDLRNLPVYPGGT